MMLSSIVSRTALRRNVAPAAGLIRSLNTHEYQSMELLKQHGVKTPNAYVASTPEEAENLFLHSLNKCKFLCRCDTVIVPKLYLSFVQWRCVLFLVLVMSNKIANIQLFYF